ncbi:hypothetical protein [Streptomyces sp. NPDC007264]|uniref:hypothetical protein n=1 Tax=Streptomyces sp. NPDC007264 TaxID=3364777 RepID=UPI0036D77FC6
MAAEHDGADALMAAITGEPLPDGAGADPAFMAEYRAAGADVALLREQLGIIGDALARPAARPAPVGAPGPERGRERGRGRWRERGRWRRPGARALGLGVLVTAVVTAVVMGTGWLVARGGVGADSGAGAKAADSRAGESRDEAGYLACARLVVEGTVTGLDRVPDGTRYRITVSVDRYYKPASGKDEVGFLADPADGPRPHEGEHVLVGLPHGEAVADLWVTGEAEIARERALVLDALPASRTITCGP